jgi:Flp pilus assembly pilin Flp
MILNNVVSAFRHLMSSKESGQSLVEYSMIIGLIAIAAIAGISLVSSQVGSLWGGIVSDVTEAVKGVLS